MQGNIVTLQKLDATGFITVDDVFTEAEVNRLSVVINSTPVNNDTFRQIANLFAIRQFLKEVPSAIPLIFNDKLLSIITGLFGHDYFVTKAIYFDKPAQSNWFVAYHQDLTISVDAKIEAEGYGPWTVKQNQFSVQPPVDILRNNFTIRIHLDDTDEDNGALKVIKGSHQKDIYRPETIDWLNETELSCPVKKGGVMLMRPLLLHSSSRSTNKNPRRVIHIEFSNVQLAEGLNWSEKVTLPV